MPATLRLRIPECVSHLIRHLHPEIKKKIRMGLELIVQDPSGGKSLRKELAGLMSLKVGRIRIIYRISQREIEIVAIGPRFSIYKETLRLLRKI